MTQDNTGKLAEELRLLIDTAAERMQPWLQRVSEAGDGSQPADLGPAVLADDVGGDAEQPRARVRPGLVEPSPLPQRDGERLGGHVVGQVAAQPAHHEAVHVAGVPLPDHREPVGVGDRARDHRAIVLVRVHNQFLPATGLRVHGQTA